MRKPRPEDFDPDYKEPNPLIPEKVDLSGIIAIKSKSQREPEENQDSNQSVRVEESVRDVRGVRYVHPINKRETKRHAFDIYKDQLGSLIEMKFLSMKEGKLKSMSAMVREALDCYIETEDNRTPRTQGSLRTD
jgi:hypothetical protein